MSSIKLDLFRRDFTINTLAIELNPEKFGTLIDFFSAQKDLKVKMIRVLHNMSFVEDPTRVFRAIRFEQRFGFTIGKVTEGLIQNAVKMDFFKRLSGRRVFTELRLILEEDNPAPYLKRLHDYGLLKVIHPSIEFDDDLTAVLSAVKKVVSWHDLLFLDESYMRWAVYLLALTCQGDRKTAESISQRLELAPKYSVIFCRDRFEADRCLYWLERHMPVSNSEVYNRLRRFKTELILYMMGVSPMEEVKRAISIYFTRLRYVHISVKGKDLLAMKVPPGPIYRDILQAVRDAKLDGQLSTPGEELDFVRRYLHNKTNGQAAV